MFRPCIRYSICITYFCERAPLLRFKRKSDTMRENSWYSRRFQQSPFLCESKLSCQLDPWFIAFGCKMLGAHTTVLCWFPATTSLQPYNPLLLHFRIPWESVECNIHTCTVPIVAPNSHTCRHHYSRSSLYPTVEEVERAVFVTESPNHKWRSRPLALL